MKRAAFTLLLALFMMQLGCNATTNKPGDSTSGQMANEQEQRAAEEQPTSWRGPNSTGVYPESGLMKEWPEGGPDVLWHYDDLGEGFSSPAVANGKIYITGMENGKSYLYILSSQGKFIKKYETAKEWDVSYPGSRSTPTVAGNLIYTYTGYGILTCIDEKKEQIVWQKNMFEDFDGENIQWGVTESVVVDGEKVYCSPGGAKNNVIALNRFTGTLIWTCPGLGEASAYCTPTLVDLSERKLLVTMMANHIIGIDAQNGKLLWSHPQTNRYSVHANSPVYHEGSIYCTSGYGKGTVKLDLHDDGSKVKEAWFTDKLDNRIGGTVLLDGYLYGAGDQDRGWKCVNVRTGELEYAFDNFMKGTTIAADGRLYIYTQRGKLALAKATPNKLVVTGQTSVDMGSGQHWAHPVIHKGRLLLRHGNVLIAYNIKQ